MENLHLKNLKSTNIVTQFIKLKEAADNEDNEKVKYYVDNIQKQLFPITLKLPYSFELHIYESINHIRDIEQSIWIEFQYNENYLQNKIRKEVTKYINDLKNYEKRILPQIKEKLKDLDKITDIRKKEEELYNIKDVYTYYMFFYKSKIPEITQIVELLTDYAKSNNKSKEYIIQDCKSNISYFKNGGNYTLYKENLNPQFEEYYKAYERRKNKDPELKKLEANQTANELLEELLDKHLKKNIFSKIKDKFK